MSSRKRPFSGQEATIQIAGDAELATLTMQASASPSVTMSTESILKALHGTVGQADSS
jgi:hypothetical protein